MNVYNCRDRFRTMINVEGDSIGAAIVAHLSRKDLEDQDRRQEETVEAPLDVYSIEHPVTMTTDLSTGKINRGFVEDDTKL